MSFTDYLNKTVTIKTKTHTDTSCGDTTVSWSNSVESYACRFSSFQGNLTFDNRGEEIRADYKVFGSVEDISAGDKLVDGTTEYLIEAVYTVYDDDTAHHLEMLITRTKN